MNMNAEPLFGRSVFELPADAPTLFAGPPESPFAYTEVGGKIVLLVSWHGADPCDIEEERLQFDSIEEAEVFIAGIDEAMLMQKGAVRFHTVEPHAQSKYFEL
jgi:hypothetical protein